jgi:hypothetical protein
MNAAEKAKELVEKYWDICVGNSIPVNFNKKWNGKDNNLILERAKQCALIAVDECYKEAYKQGNEIAIIRQEFWQQVKEEIEKL